MKIMYVIDSSPINGGAPISTSILANQFVCDSNEVVMVMPKNKAADISEKGVKRVELSRFFECFPLDVFHPAKAILLAKDLKAVIEKEKPDVIHANMPRGARAIGLLRLFKMISNEIKLVYTDREHIAQFSPLIRMLYVFFIARRYNAIICITEKSMEYWRKKVKKAKTSVVPNTAGKHYETYESNMHSIVRQRLMISDKKLTIMFAGRMIASKNWPLAKEIVSKLAKEDIHIIFAISYSNQEQENETHDFLKGIQELGVNYTFKENIPQNEMNELYYAADIFILTSNRESFGRTAIEAMSRKCAVLGRNVGGLPEVIQKEANILDCDAEKFVNRIIEYKENIGELETDKEWFYERYVNNYTVETYKRKHGDVYRNAIL